MGDSKIVPSRAQKDLCSGRGLDLEWGQKTGKLDIETIIEIARLKMYRL